ncbi:hypothetical protein HK405_001813, partial [Cladochytrium tenue]
MRAVELAQAAGKTAAAEDGPALARLLRVVVDVDGANVGAEASGDRDLRRDLDM